MVRPHPAAASRTRCAVPAMAVRAPIEPPRALGNDHFPVTRRRNRRGKKERPRRKRRDHNGMPGLGRKPAMARPPSEVLTTSSQTPRRERALGDARWPRIAGLRVVASWPEGGYARPPKPVSLRARLAGGGRGRADPGRDRRRGRHVPVPAARAAAFRGGARRHRAGWPRAIAAALRARCPWKSRPSA